LPRLQTRAYAGGRRGRCSKRRTTAPCPCRPSWRRERTSASCGARLAGRS
jgi:hypothetical protein